MAETDATQPPFLRDIEQVAATKKEHDLSASILGACTAAIVRSKSDRSGFDAAVHTYLLYTRMFLNRRRAWR